MDALLGLTNSDLWHIGYLEMSLRIGLALILGGLIGLEREFGHHSAGFRTHILVCMGSALITVLSIYGFSAFVGEPGVSTDPARLAAQIVSGIGFLGAGTILRTGLTVSGLTTAASLWVVAAIGIASGAGFYYGAILSTVLVLISLFALNKLEIRLHRTRKNRELTIEAIDRVGLLGSVSSELERFGIHIKRIRMENAEQENMIQIHMEILISKPAKAREAIDRIARIHDVKSVQLEHVAL